MSSNGVGFAFIVGHRKSGSTWLLNMMSLHPDIRGVMETHLFSLGWSEPDPVRRTRRLFNKTPWSRGGTMALPRHYLVELAAPMLKRAKPALCLKKEERAATLPDLPLLDRMALRRKLRREQTPEAYIHTFFDFQQKRLRPRRYLLEKSPSNVNLVPTIRRIFPDSKLIVIYRDGRDVVTSDQFFTRDYGGERFDFAEATMAWRSDMEAQLAMAERDTLFACAYEDLLTDGATVARKLFEFMDLPHDRALIDTVLERSSFRFHAGRDPGQENRKRFYRKGIIGDWKNNFGEQEKRTFKALAGDMLVKLGYEKDLNW